MSQVAPVQLPAHTFTWEKYCSKMGYAVVNLLDFKWEDRIVKTKLAADVKLVGYCNAKDLSIRPRTTGFALMLEIDGEDTWCHSDSLPIL